jgi:hypothetical protein
MHMMFHPGKKYKKEEQEIFKGSLTASLSRPENISPFRPQAV